MGHEFIGEIADYGPKTHRRWKAGARVVAMPASTRKVHFATRCL
jgi:threonine dehydrogenase-like Zn-dependent dehydrogenase